MAEALCCPPETITALLIGYTPVQIKSFLKVKKKIPQYSQYDLRTKEEEKKNSSDINLLLTSICIIITNMLGPF